MKNRTGKWGRAINDCVVSLRARCKQRDKNIDTTGGEKTKQKQKTKKQWFVITCIWIATRFYTICDPSSACYTSINPCEMYNNPYINEFSKDY